MMGIRSLGIMAHNDRIPDKKMGVLNSIFHHYLNIRPYLSCSEPMKLTSRLNSSPRVEFHVSFFLPMNYPEGVHDNNLSIIREAIRLYDGKVFLENDNETYNLPIQEGFCSWTLSGYGVSPMNFASSLFSQYLLMKGKR